MDPLVASPIRRQEISAPPVKNGPVQDAVPYRTHHTPERDLPGGANWVVQKFGGTSVGKVGVKIAEDIVRAGLKSHRIAVVCSARSSDTKSQGTTNRLLRAAHHVLEPGRSEFVKMVEALRVDHVKAGQLDVTDADILRGYVEQVNTECMNLLRILESAQFLKAMTSQTKDMVMSTGERLACMYMTAVLQSHGVQASLVDVSEVIDFTAGKDLTEDFYARLTSSLARRIRHLDANVVPVITGYFGSVPGGLLQQVGRGYTDLCAALVAVGLGARELQIWKEVDGIFTADPRKVPTARLLDSVTPSEAAELTFYGSEVIHPFTMDQVIKASIPIRIKNVMNPRINGTVVLPDPETDSSDTHLSKRPGTFRPRSASHLSAPRRPTAVTIKKDITIINIHSKKRTRAHGFLMRVFHLLDSHGLSVDLISSSEVHVSMALHSDLGFHFAAAATPAPATPSSDANANVPLYAAIRDLNTMGDVDVVPHMAIISLVGRQLRSMIGISGKFFSALGDHGINIEMISQGASEINISCVIEEGDADRALNVVHTNLFTFLE